MPLLSKNVFSYFLLLSSSCSIFTHGRRLGGPTAEFRRILDGGNANMNNCEAAITNSGSACGGGSDDPTTQGSCTPWPFRGARGTDNPYQDFCTGDDVGFFAGAWDKGGNSDSFGVWYDDSQGEFDETKNYWVIHGCDGAGIQVGDCQGGQALVEQIGPYSSTYADGSTGAWNGQVVPLTNDYSDSNMDAHVSTVFQHPGTNKVYDWK